METPNTNPTTTTWQGYSGKLSAYIKTIYSLGLAASGIKDAIFQAFLFIYFNQVLGLNPTLAGGALVIALIFDAVSDPIMGVISDNWKSEKWGRRHPFMFASAFPLGISIYLLFSPPSGLSEMALFAWMTTFVILVRLSLTLLIVPHSSLGAEMTTDYEERTSITVYKIAVSSFITPIITIIGFLFFFVPTAQYENGLDNKEAYPSFALFCSVLMVLFILISTYGTRKIIPTLPQTSSTEQYSLLKLFSNIQYAFRLKSFNSLLGYTMTIYIAIGLGTTFTTYFMKYYFELSTQEMAVLPVGIAIGAVLSFIITPTMARKYDKKKANMISTIFFAFFFSLPFNARLLGIFPQNGEPTLLLYYFIFVTLAYTFIWVSLSLALSMMADVIDESQTLTNTRQEGLFFSSMSFAYKCTTGIGFFLSGILLSVIQFPEPEVVNGVIKTIQISDISSKTLYQIGLIGGPLSFFAYLVSLFFLQLYPISKARYKEIRATLNRMGNDAAE
jgi:glycoside/pentoside/hexuronide:cation symporter, GPH family